MKNGISYYMRDNNTIIYFLMLDTSIRQVFIFYFQCNYDEEMYGLSILPDFIMKPQPISNGFNWLKSNVDLPGNAEQKLIQLCFKQIEY